MPKYYVAGRFERQRPPRKIRPARVKLNPREKDELQYGTIYIDDNGAKTAAFGSFCCIGHKQRIFQGPRHNLSGAYRDFDNSYCEVQIKRSASKEVHGSVTGQRIDWTKFQWVPITISGNLASTCDMLGTIRPQFVAGFGFEPTPKSSNVEFSTIKAYGNMASPKADIGLMAGEIGETFHLLKRPLSSLMDFAQYLAHNVKKLVTNEHAYKNMKRFHLYQKALSTATNTWLEYRMAIMPTLMDVDDLCKVAAEGLVDMSTKIHKVRGTSVSTWDVPVLYSDTAKSIPPTSMNLYWQGNIAVKQKSTTIVFYKDRTYMEAARNLAAMGFSPVQIPSLLWELTPFSFVVDRFVGIGQWIRAIAPNPTVDVVGSSLSTTMESLYTMELSRALIGANPAVITETPKWQAQIDSFSRTANPKLSLHPVVNPAVLKLQQQVDHVALIWGNLPRVFNYFYKAIKPNSKG